ncbi:MAG: DNA-processing protein DprA [Thermomicrobiales bacterium]
MSDPPIDAEAERAYLVALIQVPFIGPAAIATLRDAFGSAEAAWMADRRLLRRVLRAQAAAALESARGQVDVNTIYGELDRDDIAVVTIDDEEYPSLLREIHLPPPVLFVRGSLVGEERDAVAIVGTRQISPYGRTMTGDIATGLAQAGVTVVSGMAIGVDGVAHQAALDAGGRTVAVLGSGLRQIYPAEHRRLAERIAGQGAVISDYPPDTKPDARNFPARNRIISGMSRGVVVTEAPEKSGALITVDFAADQGRDVCAVPGPIGATKSAGCNALIRKGAYLARSAQDVLDDLGIGKTPEQLAVQQTLPLSEWDRVVLGVLSGEPKHIDDICEAANLPMAQVSALLMMLSLHGLVEDAGMGHYIRKGR